MLYKYRTDEEIEADVREFYKDLPDGAYNIGTEGTDMPVCITGRGGYIEFMIVLNKSIRDELIQSKE
jgi:hypothetical protein